MSREDAEVRIGRRRPASEGLATSAGLLAWAGLLVLGGCAGEPEPPSVEIRTPADGAAVSGPSVRVELAARGIEIAPATSRRSGTAHHHLFIDREATRPGDTIPVGVRGVVHLDRGETDYIVMGLSRGSHRLIALLADRDHVPLDPPAADTARITVTGGR